MKVKDLQKINYKCVDIYINFFYKKYDTYNESEVVLHVDELYEHIKECEIHNFDAEEDCLYLDVDVEEYILRVLTDPVVGEIAKDMLRTYIARIRKGDSF